MGNWVIRSKNADFASMIKNHKISEVVARILANRGVLEDDEIDKFLYPSIEGLYDPEYLKDIDKASDILQDKIKQGKSIRIVGDYDVDGIVATYVLYTGLVKCGANVDYEIPDRIKDGYGISIDIINAAHEDGIDTIITCDNGIAAYTEIDRAKGLGMTVIITDHHEIPLIQVSTKEIEQIPNADAVINSKQKDCQYPNKDLCGAAIAFKLIQYLYKLYNIENEHLHPLLEVVAVATVCDVMDLVGENRILVKLGLKYLRNSSNYGINALVDACDININHLSAYHLGFIIGPCLNASGRLDTAKKGLQLLLSKSKDQAYQIAKELKKLNNERKDMTAAGVEEARMQIETSPLREDKVLVIFLPDCHESIAGIIAGRIREQYNRPTIVLTRSEKGVKGSGRSIEQYNMFKELTKSKEYLINFGGHPMAAGLSLVEENISPFRESLNELTTLTDEDLIPKVTIDVVLPLGYINEDLVNELKVLEPFGKGNPRPVFAERNIKVIQAFLLGKNKNTLKFNLINKYGKKIDGLYFGDTETFLDSLRAKFGEEEVEKMFLNMENKIKFNITYYPNINEYNGNRTVQIIISNYLMT